MDIRLQTGIIIEKDGEFLVCAVPYSSQLRWSSSPWDAWITRKMRLSAMVAERVGGIEMLFNPVAGQLRKLRRNKFGQR